jgi:hypothetical protein
MTSRTTLFLDRLATLLVGLLLLAAGLGAGWWWSGRSGLGRTLDTGAATDVVTAAWWPVVSVVVGVLLALVGLRWIAAHLTRQTVSRLHVRGSGSSGRLDATAGKVVGAAADAFADTIGIRSARGSLVRDRGQLVATITATVEKECDLGALASRADLVSAQLAQVLERDDVRCRVQLKVARFGSRMPRAT